MNDNGDTKWLVYLMAAVAVLILSVMAAGLVAADDEPKWGFEREDCSVLPHGRARTDCIDRQMALIEAEIERREAVIERLKKAKKMKKDERLLMGAHSGVPLAQHLLGLKYSIGHDGWPYDLDLAQHWLTQAAQAGDERALDSLADLLAFRSGLPTTGL